MIQAGVEMGQAQPELGLMFRQEKIAEVKK